MTYDFESRPERKGMDALAVDALGQEGCPGAPKAGFDPIPMWVADMNFVSFPGIQESIIRRVQHPSFGYFRLREDYYRAIISWQEKRNGVRGLEKEHIGYENGVLGGVVSAVNVLCSRGDAILLHSPTYIGFTGSLTNNGYKLVLSPLKKDAAGVWRMDFQDMEERIRKEHIHVLVFCSPHNPCGRVWTEEELRSLSDLCEKYELSVVSDEIWSDIILPGFRHIPLQSVSPYLREHTVALYAPSKTFNLAGLVGSYHIIYNRVLRERVLKESSLSHYNMENVLSMYALMGACTEEGMAWTDQMRQVISANVDLAEKALAGVGGVSLSRPQGTYMLFPDFESWCRQNGKTMDELERACWDVGVALQDGRMFHGAWNLRVNLALPTRFVAEAFDRLKQYVFR